MNLHAPKGIDVENWFIECYRKHKGHPLKILIGLYKGNYNRFARYYTEYYYSGNNYGCISCS